MSVSELKFSKQRLKTDLRIYATFIEKYLDNTVNTIKVLKVVGYVINK